MTIGDENRKAFKAKNLRYRRAALQLMRLDDLHDELDKISEECEELEWAVQDDEKLIDVFDGDTDEIVEFRMMFSVLSAKCCELIETLRGQYVTEHFDDFFVGALGGAYSMVGYDSFQEDWYGLTSFEAGLAQETSGKRLMKLTKENLIATAGQCVGVMMCFLEIRHSYDCLKSVFDALRDDRAELIGNVRTVEDLYDRMQEDPGNYSLSKQFDEALWRLPDRVWVE